MSDIATFRAAFPTFSEALFSGETVAFWLRFAENQCPSERWGTQREMGVFLLTAHHLTLIKASDKADGTGGMDAAGGGIVSESKTVGGISKSISRAGAATSDVKATHYNDTTYGKQYWALVQTVGIGGLVI